jgi:arylsulfatase A-like enzyme
MKPNIIWIMSDDLSYADIGPYGQKIIQTPCLDRMAREGMCFSQAYAGSTVCAPSRSCLMTGLHTGHTRVRENSVPIKPGGFWDEHADHLRKEDLTVAEVLKQAGYATALVGKWALAHAGTEGTPLNKGFDEHMGFLDQARAHSYYPEIIWKNGKACEIEENKDFRLDLLREYTNRPWWDMSVSTKYDDKGNLNAPGMKDSSKLKNTHDLCTEQALDFIERKAGNGEPFFLYLAYQVPHGPLIVPSLEPYTNREDFPSLRHKEWAAMITRMDGDIGKILDLLKEKGEDDNTLVIFASDNGYSAYGYFGLDRFETVPFFNHRGPFQGGKFNLQEGGVRVPMIARWPKTVPAGHVTEELFAFWDFLPTAAELAGIDPGELRTGGGRELDGLSMVQVLKGNKPEKAHDWYYWEYKHSQAVRLGDFRGLREHPDQELQLFKITTDPGERLNLADQFPDLVKRIEKIMEEDRFDSDTYRNPGETDEECWARNGHLPSNIHNSNDPKYYEWLKSLGIDTEPFGLS